MFFSVIVPVYNVEKYLDECVMSILNQSFSDFELILVDDGSKDSSGKICDDYAEKDARVKVIHKENGGQSTARNKGVDVACGEYAIFLDSDDFIDDKDFFKDLYEKAKDKADVVIFRYFKYYEDGSKNDCNVSLADINYSDKAELFTELVKRDAFFCSCWSKCTSLKLLKENKIVFDENLRCEDMDWYYSVVSVAEKYEVIDKPYINYRQRENSVTSSFNPKSIYDYIITIDKWYNILKEEKDEALRYALLSSLAKLYCNLLISYARNKEHLKDAKKKIFAFRELLSYPMNPRTRMIAKFNKMFGLNLTCTALRLFNKVKK